MEKQDTTELTPVRARVASGDTSEARMRAYLEHDDDPPALRLAIWKKWKGHTNEAAASAIGVHLALFAGMLNGATAGSVRILERFEIATGIPATDFVRAKVRWQLVDLDSAEDEGRKVIKAAATKEGALSELRACAAVNPGHFGQLDWGDVAAVRDLDERLAAIGYALERVP